MSAVGSHRGHADFCIVHRAICRHRVEIEVQPSEAELYFSDERWIDPINTELRFDAVVYNVDTGVNWQVLAPDGGPGAGTIDPTGLYRAPTKGTSASGATDVVVASARADPLRRAYAFVTLVGLGPLLPPKPAIEIWPKSRALYYAIGADNGYIDQCNKMQLFRAFPKNSAATGVTWKVDGVVQAGMDGFFLYRTPNTGADYSVHTVSAEIPGMPAVADSAKVVLRNYVWPGL